MTDDRELLELAAKAARIKIDKSETNGGGHGNTGFDCMGNAVLDWHNNKTWNPLKDDGDALRLAVKIAIDIEFFVADGATSAVQTNWCEYHCNIGRDEVEPKGDPYAATRRAIVRAAAEIGRNMK